MLGQSVKFSFDGISSISSSFYQKIKIWQLESGQEKDLISSTGDGHTDSVNSLDFAKSGNRLVSGSSDKSIIVWNLCSAELILIQFKRKHPSSVSKVAFSFDGKTTLAGCDNYRVRIWDAFSGSLNKSIPGTISCNYECRLFSRPKNSFYILIIFKMLCFSYKHAYPIKNFWYKLSFYLIYWIYVKHLKRHWFSPIKMMKKIMFILLSFS